ncbi:MAG: hypothetical protein Q9191_002060 [Dirinaria sp. TL-2023a]
MAKETGQRLTKRGEIASMKGLSKEYTRTQRSLFDIRRRLPSLQEEYELLTRSPYQDAGRIAVLLNQQNPERREFLGKPREDTNFWATLSKNHSAIELEEEKFIGWEENGVLKERLSSLEDEERKLESALAAIRQLSTKVSPDKESKKA